MDRPIPPPFNEVPVTVQVSSTADLALPMVREACLRARFGATFPDQGADPMKVGADGDGHDRGAALLGCARERLSRLTLFVKEGDGTVSIAIEFGAQKNQRGDWKAIATMYFDHEGEPDYAQHTVHVPLNAFTDHDDEAVSKAVPDALREPVTSWLTERFVAVGRQLRAAKRRDDLLDLRRDADAAYHDVPVLRYRHRLAVRIPVKEDGPGKLAYRRPDLRGRWHETDVLGRRLAELLPTDIDLLVADERDAALLHVMGQATELDTLLLERKAIDQRGAEASTRFTANGFDDSSRYWTVVEPRQLARLRGMVVGVVRAVVRPRTCESGMYRWLRQYSGARDAYELAVFAHRDTEQRWPDDTSRIVRLIDLPQRPPTG